MARGYPRFLFSNPQNVKTPGPFIIHTLFPEAIFKLCTKDEVINQTIKYSGVIEGEDYDAATLKIQPCSSSKEYEILSRAHAWFSNQPEAEMFKK